MTQIAEYEQPALWQEQTPQTANYAHNPGIGAFDIMLLAFVFASYVGTRHDAYNEIVKAFGWVVALFFPLRWLVRPIPIPREFVIYGVFVIWCSLTTLFGEYGFIGRSLLLTVIQLAILFLLIVGTLDSGRKIAALAWIMAPGVIVAAALPGLEGSAFKGERLEGSMSNANYLGMSCLITMGFLFFLMRRGNPVRILLIFTMIAGLVAIIIMTSSRNTSMGLVVLVMFFFWFRYGDQMKRNPAKLGLFIGITAIVFVISISLLAETKLMKRWHSGIEVLQGVSVSEGSTMGRLHYYKQGLIESFNNPIMGGGLGYETMFLGNSVHNNYLSLLLDTGWPGTALYYGIYLSLLLRMRRLRRAGLTNAENTQVSAMQALLVSMAVMDINQVLHFYKPYIITLSAIAAYSTWLTNQILANNAPEDREDPHTNTHAAGVI